MLVVAHVADPVRRLDLSRARTAIARALALSRARTDFRIVHLALRTDLARDARLELIVEAADHRALARGMQGFQVSAARGLNRAVRRSGTVFVDRYRARALTTRPAVAAAIARLPPEARRRLVTPDSPLFP